MRILWLIGLLALSLSSPALADPDPLSRACLFPNKLTVLTPRDRGLVAEPVEFPNALKKTLRGWFFDSAASDQTILVCMGNAGNSSYMIDYAAFLVESGFDVLLFDYQGFGRSEGEASVFALLGDGLAAFDFLVHQKGRPPDRVGVLGISLGSVLSLAIAAQRKPAAVAIEDVYLPADQLRAFAGENADEPVIRTMISLAERVLLPMVDPLANARRIDRPVLFLHGEADWLLPPSGTMVVSEACAGPKRVWFMAGVGHAPESLEVNDREFRYQITAFFHEAFERGVLAGPAVRFRVEPRDNAWHVFLTVESPARAAVQLALADQTGRFQFVRRWIDAGSSSWQVPSPFRPEHVSAVALHHISSNGDGTWSEQLGPQSESLAAFKAFRTGLLGVAAGSSASDGRGRVPRATPAHWRWSKEHLPAVQAVHPRVRPRYAQILADLSYGLTGSDRTEAIEAAAALLPFLPDDPATYYELGNATFQLGLRGTALAESCHLLGTHRLAQGDRAGAKTAFRRYLQLLPTGAALRITAQEIDAL
jgi:hypothetical protein